MNISYNDQNTLAHIVHTLPLTQASAIVLHWCMKEQFSTDFDLALMCSLFS